MHLEQKTQQDISLSAVPDVWDGKGRELAKDHEGRSWGRNGRNGMESRKSPAGGHGLSHTSLLRWKAPMLPLVSKLLINRHLFISKARGQTFRPAGEALGREQCSGLHPVMGTRLDLFLHYSLWIL